MDKNKVFHGLIRKCWHEYDLQNSFYCLNKRCEKQYRRGERNPDYAADPRLVLMEMEKREDWDKFCDRLFWYIADKTEIIKNFCEVFILDTTGKLRDAGIEWKRKEKDHE